MPSASPHAQEHDAAPAPLCPNCGSPVVRIDTSVEVKYLVQYALVMRDLEVLSEQLGDAGWDDHTPAACDACGWRGEVGALGHRHKKR